MVTVDDSARKAPPFTGHHDTLEAPSPRTSERRALTDLFRMSVRSQWATLPAAWGTVFYVWGEAPLLASLVWAGLLTLFTVYRNAALRRRLAAPDFLSDPAREGRFHMRLVLATAVGIASGFAYFSVGTPDYIGYGLMAIAVAMAAGSAVVFATHRASFLAYAMPFAAVPVVALSFRAWDNNSPQTLFMVGMALVYVRVLMVAHAQIHGILMENFDLQIEKDALLEKLRVDNIELHADRDAYRNAALTDELTRIPNRRCFDMMLRREWERGHREATPVACVMLDIDHFKAVNDHYGHHVGDDYLVHVAAALTRQLNRGTDFLARYGGEEFVAILPNTDRNGARLIAEQLRASVAGLALDSPVASTGGKVTVSAGVCTLYPKDDDGAPQRLVDLADAALYRAKRSGRDRVVVSDPRH